MHDILKSAMWVLEYAFATFYRLNLAVTAANFGTNVLNTVLDRH